MGALMGRLEAELREVEADVAEQVRRWHLRAQLLRLAAGVAAAILVSLKQGGPGPLDWQAIASVAGGALWTQVRAIWPTVPWDMLRDWLDLPAGTAPSASRGTTAP